METDVICWSEFEAYRLLYRGPMTTEPVNYHEYGDKLIALAEKIKSERAVVAMRYAAKACEK